MTAGTYAKSPKTLCLFLNRLQKPGWPFWGSAGVVYRVVRFSVPVAFSVLTGRVGHPRLRDDVGIVPYAGGGMVWFDRDD